VRGGDPDAALHYLARMLEAGEDPVFVARRLLILASEDIGNADPHGLPLAVAAAEAVQLVGMPEGRIPLAQGHYLSGFSSEIQRLVCRHRARP
jgi:putative ATPase